MCLLKVRISLLIIILLPFAPGYALPTDKEQMMHVVADTADLNQQKHQGTYTGNVAFVQGSTHLRAAHAVTQGNLSNQLILAIANGIQGQPAHFWMKTSLDKPPLHAYADTIRYHPLKHLIELIGHARIKQGSNSLSGAKISYDTIKQQVVAQGDNQTRTTIIFYPEKKSL